jgi:serine/threonine-protein kinase RsbW
VSDGEYGHDSGNRSPRSVEVRVAAKLENLAVLRTVVGAVGTYEDLDFDSVADLRLAVDEACTRLIRSATSDATPDIVVPGSFSWHVLSSLTDDVSTFHDGHGPEDSHIFGISMTTRRASSLR